MAADSKRHLDPVEIGTTIATLRRRITERFPDSGLAGVAEQLGEAASRAGDRVARLGRPHLPLRVLITLIVLLLPVLGWWSVTTMHLEWRLGLLHEFIQTVEAALASVVFVGAAVVFLFSLEARIERRQVLRHLYELRELVHIVDMHQLTKDPERVMNEGPSTASSPVRTMTAYHLGRYFDYCSEMMSLTSKVAALYAGASVDPHVISAVDDLEDLATGMSQKIWQKISLVNMQVAPEPAPREVKSAPQPEETAPGESAPV